MWTRKEVKQKGHTTFMLNYWRSVLMALILSVVVSGAAGSSASFSVPGPFVSNTGVRSSSEDTNADIDVDELEDIASEIGLEAGNIDPGMQKALTGVTVAGVAILIVSVLVLCLIITAFAVVWDALVINPLLIGGNRFFVKNLDEPAKVSSIGFSFDHNYKNIAKVMFFRDLYTFLWGLLFIIPGIIKKYEYRMMPYIMAENPDMDMDEVFAKSKQMMTGNKWKAFVLDLSFIGWHILNGFTLGILGIFYLSPYIYQTNAALYRKLSDANIGEVATVEENVI